MQFIAIEGSRATAAKNRKLIASFVDRTITVSTA
jgi:hypothetical protein